MKGKLLIGASVAVIFLFGCRNSSNRLQVGTADDTLLLSTWEMEIQLKDNYEAVERDYRQNYGVRDQNQINQMMQMHIDDGELPIPYVFKRDAAGLKIEYLSYVAYKAYRARIPIDTTKVMTIYIDSLQKSLDSVHKRHDSLQNIIEKP